jgi:hypothetical protein
MDQSSKEVGGGAPAFRLQKKVDQLFDRFLLSQDHHYLSQFVKKLPHQYTREELRMLFELLRERWEMTEMELVYLLRKEKGRQIYEDFKAKALSTNPTSLEGYVGIYLQLAGEYCQLKLPILARLLADAGYAEAEDDELIIAEVERQLEVLKLQRFKKKLFAGDPIVTIYDIDRYTGFEFEEFLERLYFKMGYQTKQTKLTGDQGADLLATKFGEITVLQAKRYDTSCKVGNSAVQEVVASIRYYNAHRGVVVTNTYFTRQAVALARSNGVELIDRDKLIELIRNYY